MVRRRTYKSFSALVQESNSTSRVHRYIYHLGLQKTGTEYRNPRRRSYTDDHMTSLPYKIIQILLLFLLSCSFKDSPPIRNNTSRPQPPPHNHTSTSPTPPNHITPRKTLTPMQPQILRHPNRRSQPDPQRTQRTRYKTSMTVPTLTKNQKRLDMD